MLKELKKALLIDKISFWIFTATVLLLPFFFIPYAPMPVLVGKSTFLFIGIALSFCFWLIARLVDGKFKMPKSLVVWCGFLIALAFLISSLFSPVFSVSFWGQGFETGTFAFIFAMFVGMFLTSIFFNQIKSSVFLVVGLSFSFLVSFFFILMNLFSQLVHFSFWLNIMPVNVVGSWNDLAIFAGLIAVLALATAEFLPVDRKWKKVSYLWLVLSLLIVVLVNFSSLWIVLGVFSLLVFVYSMSMKQGHDPKKSDPKENDADDKKDNSFPIASFLTVLICLFFILASNFFSGFLSKYVNIENIDVRPSLSATWTVAKSSLAHNPVVGSGPNLFVSEWLSYKPAHVNNSIFWNTDFSIGFGTIPSYLVTTGILGLVLWVLFFFLFFREGARSFSIKIRNKFDKQMILVLFTASLFLWIFSIVYAPGVVVFFLSFLFTGLFIGLLASSKKPAEFYSFSFVSDPRNSFFSILAIVAFIIVSITGGYIVSEKLYATVLFEKASYSNTIDSVEGIQKVENLLIRAINSDSRDVFLRSLSNAYLIHLNLIVSQKQTGSLDSSKQDLQDNLKKAEDSAILAVKANPKNYQNFTALGNVYASVLPLGVSEAYENAKSAYEQALVLNPKNPEILLLLAQLEIANKNNAQGISYLDQALAMKPNYAQAFFELGSLRYQAGDYASASGYFENVVVLMPSDINVRYLLAVSYSKSGKGNEAIVQFEILAKAYPENLDIQKGLEEAKNIKQSLNNKTSEDNTKESSASAVKK